MPSNSVCTRHGAAVGLRRRRWLADSERDDDLNNRHPNCVDHARCGHRRRVAERAGSTGHAYLLVGVILLIAACCARLVIENVNQATLIGIKAGVGLTVAASQLPNYWVSNRSKRRRLLQGRRVGVAPTRPRQCRHMLVSVGAIAVLSRWLAGRLLFRSTCRRGIGIALAAPRLPELGVPHPEVPRAPAGATCARSLPTCSRRVGDRLMAFLETLAVAGACGVSMSLRSIPIVTVRQRPRSYFGAFFHACPRPGGPQTGMT